MRGISRTADEEKEANTTLNAKNKAIEAFDTTFSYAADMISTMLRAAGEKELAKKVRPSGRRTGQTAEIAEGAEGAEDEEGAEIPDSKEKDTIKIR